MVATGAARSYEALLVSRLALGAVMATTGPTIPSLVGDYIAPAVRPGESATARGSDGGVEVRTGQGLEVACLVLLFGARRTSSRDAATAAASTAAIGRARDEG
jgi:hypothetical protein